MVTDRSPAVTLDGVGKSFPGKAAPALVDISAAIDPGTVRRDHREVRGGEDHAASLSLARHLRHERGRPVRRDRPGPAPRRVAPPPSRAGRDDLPAVQPRPALAGDRQRAGRPPRPPARLVALGGARPALRRGPARDRVPVPGPRRPPGSRRGSGPIRSPAASSSAWRSRRSWPRSPPSCSPTSRSRAST